MRRSGNAKRLALLNVLSVDSSLKIELYEGICGRFGRIGVDTRSISDQQGMWFNRATDDLVKLHVCGSRYFGNLAHRTKDLSSFRG